MSDKPQPKGTSGASEPALARMLLVAIHEHEGTLARVSRLLHDDVSQVLSAVGLQLDVMRMDFRDQASGIDVRAAEIQTMLEQAIEQLRAISNELNPSIVERAGLQFALDQLAGKTRTRFAGTLRLQLDSTAHVPPPIAKAFYKVAECAVDNAVAAPECSLIEIQLKRSQGEFVLEVHHDGDAQPAAENVPSLNHLLMDYHASANGLTLVVDNSPEKGTVTRASFPVPPAVESAG